MKIRSQIQNQKGQGLIEYLIIVALVAVATIGIVRVVGQNVSVQYANIAKALGGEDDRQYTAGKVEDQMYKKKDLSDFLHGAASGTSKGKTNETH
jgi:pilus assembly protein Flp/PilA